MRRLKVLWAIALSLIVVGTSSGKVSHDTPVFDVDRPMILAFFRPSSDINKPGTSANDSLSDFQAYLKRANDPLQKAGIDVHEVYARSFQVRDGGKTTTFQTKKMNIGYYLVAPARKRVSNMDL
jgi:hypothetical protein